MRPRTGRPPLRRPREIADVPASPPAHVLCDVDRAARRVDELQDAHCELHFEMDADRRVVVQLRDLNGRVLRTIAPSEALEILSGHSPRPRPPYRSTPQPAPPNRKVP